MFKDIFGWWKAPVVVTNMSGGYNKQCRHISKDTPNNKGHAVKHKALRKLQRKSRKV